MPYIGEVKTGKEIRGGNNLHRFIWYPCEKCGKERWVLIVKGKPKSKWCNACAIRKPRRGKIKVCPICGEKFYICPSSVKIYCSVECQNEGQRKGKPLVCKVCGKEYYRSPAQIRLRGSSCCSNKCKGEAVTIFHSGENSFNWQGGVSTENHRQRASKQWRIWREAVFSRDNWTCQRCGARSGNGSRVALHPHHIKPFAKYPDLRFEVSNGITLCKECHKEVHHENKAGLAGYPSS